MLEDSLKLEPQRHTLEQSGHISYLGELCCCGSSLAIQLCYFLLQGCLVCCSARSISFGYLLLRKRLLLELGQLSLSLR